MRCPIRTPFPATSSTARRPGARGIAFTPTGTTTGFQTSSTAASGEPVPFGFASTFSVFSAQRLFIGLNGPTFDATFFNPADRTTPATTRGFGAVFTGVEDAGATRLDYCDGTGALLRSEAVPTTNPAGGLSCLGVMFDTASVARVSVAVGGVSAFDGTNFSVRGDAVAMDDFLFGERRAVAVSEPALGALFAAGLAAVVRLGRGRLTVAP